MNDVHAAVAEKLWTLIVVNAELVRHLTFIRNFFLLGKGEFYRCFIDSSRKMLSEPPKDLRRSEAAVNLGPWKRAAELCGLDDDLDYDDDDDENAEDYAGLRLRLLSSSFSLSSFNPSY